jgi:hypothetical protein
MKDGSNETATREEMPAFLRQLTRRRAAQGAGEERCELCSAPLAQMHQHLLDPKKRQIVCACDGCVILFCGQTGAHYLRVPRRIQRLVGFRMTDLQWDALMLPINLAFFYRDSSAGRVLAMYPSPAGATESLLSLESWEEIVAQNAALERMEPDVEALLVNRIGLQEGGGAAYFVVPIDECYRLVGLIRLHWRGLSGGAEVWREIQQFFVDLTARGVAVGEVSHA